MICSVEIPRACIKAKYLSGTLVGTTTRTSDSERRGKIVSFGRHFNTHIPKCRMAGSNSKSETPSYWEIVPSLWARCTICFRSAENVPVPSSLISRPFRLACLPTESDKITSLLARTIPGPNSRALLMTGMLSVTTFSGVSHKAASYSGCHSFSKHNAGGCGI